MKYFTVGQINLEDYKSASTEAVSGGSRPRIVFVHNKTNQKFFFKTYSHNTREVWAEALASHIGELIGLRIQKVTIKTVPERLKPALLSRFPEKHRENWTPIGTLARNIFPRDYEITYGAAIVGATDAPLTLDQVASSISSRYYAPEDLLRDYADMIVFDAFIGNMDRHHENWGISTSAAYRQMMMFGKTAIKDKRHFTPLFDHGSSLMFELDDNKVMEYSGDDNQLERYIETGNYSFLADRSGNKANVFHIIEEEIKAGSDWGNRFNSSIEKVMQINLLTLGNLITQMPNLKELDYDQSRKQLLHKSLLMRYNKLKGLYGRKAKRNE
jgi:hypothetical protein